MTPHWGRVADATTSQCQLERHVWLCIGPYPGVRGVLGALSIPQHQLGLQELCRNLSCLNAGTANLGMSLVGSTTNIHKTAPLLLFFLRDPASQSLTQWDVHPSPAPLLPAGYSKAKVSWSPAGHGGHQLSPGSEQVGAATARAGVGPALGADDLLVTSDQWRWPNAEGGQGWRARQPNPAPEHVMVQAEHYGLFPCVHSPCQIQLSSRRLLCF